MIKEITDDEINDIEHKLLPQGSCFSPESVEILKCMESKEIVACPGSGKTTLLMAKLDYLASRLPFENNRGICVLSHTNVAIDEIKNRLGDKAKMILEYPNYVGTIQSFIHKFIVTTYLLTKYKADSLIVLENARYEEELWRTYLKNISILTSLKFVIERNVSQNSRIPSSKEFLGSLFLDEEGKLKSAYGGGRSLANKGTKTNDQFILLMTLMRRKGVISYKEAYKLTDEAITELGEPIKELLNLRFQFVFIDEYQDCSKQQVDIINYLFENSSTVIQKIGDCDQAIYNSVQNENENAWAVREDALKLKGSNRYHQKIADVLNKLNNHVIIESLTSIDKIVPILFVYQPNNINKVLPAFAEEIINNNLNDKTEGVYKAIGMIKNGTGITIGDYWNEYQSESIERKKELYLDDFICQIYQVRNQGVVDYILKQILEIFLRAFYLAGKRREDGKSYSVTSIYKELCEYEAFNFKDWMIEIVELVNLEQDGQRTDNLKTKIIEMINQVLNEDELSKVEAFISTSSNVLSGVNANSINKNLWRFEKGNGETVDIEISTIHKVKGETHSATLYFETETRGSSDLKRIMPLFKGKQLDGRPIYEKSRKIAYVGMSRPTHLLCVAMQEKTYIGNEEAFDSWVVKKI